MEQPYCKQCIYTYRSADYIIRDELQLPEALLVVRSSLAPGVQTKAILTIFAQVTGPVSVYIVSIHLHVLLASFNRDIG